MLPKPDKKVHMVVVTDPFHLSVHLWVKTFELIPSILEKKSSHLRQNIYKLTENSPTPLAILQEWKILYSELHM